jgi:hypothetical protein
MELFLFWFYSAHIKTIFPGMGVSKLMGIPLYPFIGVSFQRASIQ